ASAENLALGPNQASLRCDGANERNFELESRLTDAFFEHRLDGKAHAGIEKRRSEAAVHSTRRIEMSPCRYERDHDAAALGFDDVVAQRLRHCIEGQLSANKPFDELEPAHCLLPFGTNGPVCLGSHGCRPPPSASFRLDQCLRRLILSACASRRPKVG